jgi:peptidoglycan hydrolase CwlO-like protein
MNPLNFLQHLFTLRAIERELTDHKTLVKELQAELRERDAIIESRDTEINQLRQEIKGLNGILHAQPLVVETVFDHYKF